MPPTPSDEKASWILRLNNLSADELGDLFVAGCVAFAWFVIILLSICGAFK